MRSPFGLPYISHLDDEAKSSSSHLAESGTARLLGAGAAASGQFFVIGGQLDDGSVTRKVEAYTP
jgi:hypothetical protein